MTCSKCLKIVKQTYQKLGEAARYCEKCFYGE